MKGEENNGEPTHQRLSIISMPRQDEYGAGRPAPSLENTNYKPGWSTLRGTFSPRSPKAC